MASEEACITANDGFILPVIKGHADHDRDSHMDPVFEQSIEDNAGRAGVSGDANSLVRSPSLEMEREQQHDLGLPLVAEEHEHGMASPCVMIVEAEVEVGDAEQEAERPDADILDVQVPVSEVSTTVNEEVEVSAVDVEEGEVLIDESVILEEPTIQEEGEETEIDGEILLMDESEKRVEDGSSLTRDCALDELVVVDDAGADYDDARPCGPAFVAADPISDGAAGECTNAMEETRESLVKEECHIVSEEGDDTSVNGAALDEAGEQNAVTFEDAALLDSSVAVNCGSLKESTDDVSTEHIHENVIPVEDSTDDAVAVIDANCEAVVENQPVVEEHHVENEVFCSESSDTLNMNMIDIEVCSESAQEEVKSVEEGLDIDTGKTLLNTAAFVKQAGDEESTATCDSSIDADLARGLMPAEANIGANVSVSGADDCTVFVSMHIEQNSKTSEEQLNDQSSCLESSEAISKDRDKDATRVEVSGIESISVEGSSSHENLLPACTNSHPFKQDNKEVVDNIAALDSGFNNVSGSLTNQSLLQKSAGELLPESSAQVLEEGLVHDGNQTVDATDRAKTVSGSDSESLESTMETDQQYDTVAASSKECSEARAENSPSPKVDRLEDFLAAGQPAPNAEVSPAEQAGSMEMAAIEASCAESPAADGVPASQGKLHEELTEAGCVEEIDTKASCVDLPGTTEVPASYTIKESPASKTEDGSTLDLTEAGSVEGTVTEASCADSPGAAEVLAAITVDGSPASRTEDESAEQVSQVAAEFCLPKSEGAAFTSTGLACEPMGKQADAKKALPSALVSCSVREPISDRPEVAELSLETENELFEHKSSPAETLSPAAETVKALEVSSASAEELEPMLTGETASVPQENFESKTVQTLAYSESPVEAAGRTSSVTSPACREEILDADESSAAETLENMVQTSKVDTRIIEPEKLSHVENSSDESGEESVSPYKSTGAVDAMLTSADDKTASLSIIPWEPSPHKEGFMEAETEAELDEVAVYNGVCTEPSPELLPGAGLKESAVAESKLALIADEGAPIEPSPESLPGAGLEEFETGTCPFTTGSEPQPALVAVGGAAVDGLKETSCIPEAASLPEVPLFDPAGELRNRSLVSAAISSEPESAVEPKKAFAIEEISTSVGAEVLPEAVVPFATAVHDVVESLITHPQSAQAKSTLGIDYSVVSSSEKHISSASILCDEEMLKKSSLSMDAESSIGQDAGEDSTSQEDAVILTLSLSEDSSSDKSDSSEEPQQRKAFEATKAGPLGERAEEPVLENSLSITREELLCEEAGPLKAEESAQEKDPLSSTRDELLHKVCKSVINVEVSKPTDPQSKVTAAGGEIGHILASGLTEVVEKKNQPEPVDLLDAQAIQRQLELDSEANKNDLGSCAEIMEHEHVEDVQCGRCTMELPTCAADFEDKPAEICADKAKPTKTLETVVRETKAEKSIGLLVSPETLASPNSKDAINGSPSNEKRKMGSSGKSSRMLLNRDNTKSRTAGRDAGNGFETGSIFTISDCSSRSLSAVAYLPDNAQSLTPAACFGDAPSVAGVVVTADPQKKAGSQKRDNIFEMFAFGTTGTISSACPEAEEKLLQPAGHPALVDVSSECSVIEGWQGKEAKGDVVGEEKEKIEDKEAGETFSRSDNEESENDTVVEKEEKSAEAKEMERVREELRKMNREYEDEDEKEQMVRKSKNVENKYVLPGTVAEQNMEVKGEGLVHKSKVEENDVLVTVVVAKQDQAVSKKEEVLNTKVVDSSKITTMAAVGQKDPISKNETNVQATRQKDGAHRDVPTKGREYKKSDYFPEDSSDSSDTEVESSNLSLAKKSSQVSEARQSSQVSEEKKSSQVSEARKSSQVSEARKSSQVSEARKSSQVSEERKSSQVSEVRKSSLVSETRKSSQVSEARKSSQVSETRKASQLLEARKSSQLSETPLPAQVEKEGKEAGEPSARAQHKTLQKSATSVEIGGKKSLSTFDNGGLEPLDDPGCDDGDDDDNSLGFQFSRVKTVKTYSRKNEADFAGSRLGRGAHHDLFTALKPAGRGRPRGRSRGRPRGRPLLRRTACEMQANPYDRESSAEEGEAYRTNGRGDMWTVETMFSHNPATSKPSIVSRITKASTPAPTDSSLAGVPHGGSSDGHRRGQEQAKASATPRKMPEPARDSQEQSSTATAAEEKMPGVAPHEDLIHKAYLKRRKNLNPFCRSRMRPRRPDRRKKLKQSTVDKKFPVRPPKSTTLFVERPKEKHVQCKTNKTEHQEGEVRAEEVSKTERKRHKRETMPGPLEGEVNGEAKPQQGEVKYNYKCKLCGLQYQWGDRYRRHMRAHDTFAAGKNHACKVCGKLFETQEKQHAHSQVHEEGRKGQFTCLKCGKVCHKWRQYLYHMKRHREDGGKMFSCKICGHHVYTNYRLKRHEAQHLQGASFTCFTCGKVFFTHKRLDKHRKVHLHRTALVDKEWRDLFSKLDQSSLLDAQRGSADPATPTSDTAASNKEKKFKATEEWSCEGLPEKRAAAATLTCTASSARSCENSAVKIEPAAKDYFGFEEEPELESPQQQYERLLHTLRSTTSSHRSSHTLITEKPVQVDAPQDNRLSSYALIAEKPVHVAAPQHRRTVCEYLGFPFCGLRSKPWLDPPQPDTGTMATSCLHVLHSDASHSPASVQLEGVEVRKSQRKRAHSQKRCPCCVDNASRYSHASASPHALLSKKVTGDEGSKSEEAEDSSSSISFHQETHKKNGTPNKGHSSGGSEGEKHELPECKKKKKKKSKDDTPRKEYPLRDTVKSEIIVQKVSFGPSHSGLHEEQAHIVDSVSPIHSSLHEVKGHIGYSGLHEEHALSKDSELEGNPSQSAPPKTYDPSTNRKKTPQSSPQLEFSLKRCSVKLHRSPHLPGDSLFVVCGRSSEIEDSTVISPPPSCSVAAEPCAQQTSPITADPGEENVTLQRDTVSPKCLASVDISAVGVTAYVSAVGETGESSRKSSDFVSSEKEQTTDIRPFVSEAKKEPLPAAAGLAAEKKQGVVEQRKRKRKHRKGKKGKTLMAAAAEYAAANLALNEGRVSTVVAGRTTEPKKTVAVALEKSLPGEKYDSGTELNSGSPQQGQAEKTQPAREGAGKGSAQEAAESDDSASTIPTQESSSAADVARDGGQAAMAAPEKEATLQPELSAAEKGKKIKRKRKWETVHMPIRVKIHRTASEKLLPKNLAQKKEEAKKREREERERHRGPGRPKLVKQQVPSDPATTASAGPEQQPGGFPQKKGRKKKVYPCNICGKVSHSDSEAKIHFSKHLTKQAATWQRSYLDSVEATARSFVAGDGNVCHRCGYCANGPADLSVHVRMHSQKEHQCPVCRLAFSQASTLEMHMKAHRGEGV